MMRIFLSASQLRADRLERRPVGDGALHLAALHGEVNLRRALVAGDDLELVAEQAIEQHRVVVLRRARRLRAHDNLGGLGVFELLHRRVVPDVEHLRLAVGAAETVELGGVEARAGGLQQRRRRHAVERRADHGAVERAR